jgi:hypothetical protein
VRSRLWSALAVALVVAGCASVGAGEGVPSARGERHTLSAEAIEAAPERHVTAHDLVQGLRPAWLQRRGSATVQNPGAGAVAVYLDGTRIGGAESLRQIRREALLSIQYLDPSDATTRFGTGHSGGVILVNTRSGR